MNVVPPSVPSPCTGLCVLDEQGLCRGCRRSADEIARWTQLDDDRRRALLARLPARAAPAPRRADPGAGRRGR